MNLKPQMPSVGVASPQFAPIRAAQGMFVSKGANIAGNVLGIVKGAGSLAEGIGQYYDTNAKQAVAEINGQLKTEFAKLLDDNGGLSPENADKWEQVRQDVIDEAREKYASTERQFDYYYGPVKETYDYETWNATRKFEYNARQTANAAQVSTEADTLSARILSGASAEVVDPLLDKYGNAVLASQMWGRQVDPEVSSAVKSEAIGKQMDSCVRQLLSTGNTAQARRVLDLMAKRRGEGRPTMGEAEALRLEKACSIQEAGQIARQECQSRIAQWDSKYKDTDGKYVTPSFTLAARQWLQELGKDATPEGKVKLQTASQLLAEEHRTREARLEADVTVFSSELPGDPAARMIALNEEATRAGNTPYGQRIAVLRDRYAETARTMENNALAQRRKEADYWVAQNYFYGKIMESALDGSEVQVGGIKFNISAKEPAERKKLYNALGVDSTVQQKIESQLNGQASGILAAINEGVRKRANKMLDGEPMDPRTAASLQALSSYLFKAFQNFPVDNPAKLSATDRNRILAALDRVLSQKVDFDFRNETLLDLVLRSKGDPKYLDVYLEKEIDNPDEDAPAKLALRHINAFLSLERQYDVPGDSADE